MQDKPLWKKSLYPMLLYGSIFVYFIVSIQELFFKCTNYRGLNLVPFTEISRYYHLFSTMPKLSVYNLLGNIILFFPMGIYLQLLRKNKNWFYSLSTVMFTSIVVELSQYIFARGSCDVDDVLLNTLGGLLGIIIYRILRRCLKSKEALDHVLICLAGGTAVMTVVSKLTIFQGGSFLL